MCSARRFHSRSTNGFGINAFLPRRSRPEHRPKTSMTKLAEIGIWTPEQKAHVDQNQCGLCHHPLEEIKIVKEDFAAKLKCCSNCGAMFLTNLLRVEGTDDPDQAPPAA